MNASPDPRNVRNGRKLPGLTYCDQPYLIEPDDGSLLCVMTTGSGVEGRPGQHVAVFKSRDGGQNWSDPVPLEPVNGPESSYAVLLKAPAGRLYCFYNYNIDDIREVRPVGLEALKGTPFRHDSIGYYNNIRSNQPPFKDSKCDRVDTLGAFVFKYSDDHGETWSKERFTIPVREMEMDRGNVYGGKVRFFWNVGKPAIVDGKVFMPFIKVGNFGPGFMVSSEGVFLESPDLLTVDNPGKAAWLTWPEGDTGLRAPEGGGPIAEEHSFCVLSDGSFYCVYRTVDGYPAYALSRDQGRHWTKPAYLTYADGRRIKHPRAANFVWKCNNGKYLYWFHNHGGKFIKDDIETAYAHRNPAWLCGGNEADTADGKTIIWSQPEVILYDDDPLIRMSYPDLIEYRGRYLITETQKHFAHIHELDPVLINGLWGQFDPPPVSGITPVATLNGMPELAPFCTYDRDHPDYRMKNLNTGLTLDVCFRLRHSNASGIVADTRTPDGRGFCLELTGDKAKFTLSDGRTENSWSSDPETFAKAGPHHLTVIVDGGPSIILFAVNGALCDGGEHRQFGFGRFSPHMTDINGASDIQLFPDMAGKAEPLSFRLFDRALTVSETMQLHKGAHEA